MSCSEGERLPASSWHREDGGRSSDATCCPLQRFTKAEIAARQGTREQPHVAVARQPANREAADVAGAVRRAEVVEVHVHEGGERVAVLWNVAPTLG